MEAQAVCSAPDWSAPRIIRRTFNDSASIHPNDVAQDATKMVVTSEFPPLADGGRHSADHATPIAIRFDVGTGRVTEVRKPDPRLSYSGLRVLLGANGVAHLFWGEIAGVTVGDTTGGRGATQVWSVQLAGDSVSAAHIIYSSKDVRWGDEPRPDMQIDEDGQLHLVLLATAAITRYPFVHLTLTPQGWTHERVDAGQLVLPEAVSMVVGGGALHVVFLSPYVEAETAPFGSVFYMRRYLGQSTWTRALLVQQADPWQARLPSVSIASGGEIRAFWLQAMGPHDLYTAYTIRGAVISDSMPVVVRRMEYVGADELRALRGVWSDACNATHLHFVAGAIGVRAQALTISWNGSSWSSSDPFHHDYLFLGRSTTGLGPTGQLRRVWSTGFVAPGLPLVLFWWESSRRVVMPTR